MKSGNRISPAATFELPPPGAGQPHAISLDSTPDLAAPQQCANTGIRKSYLIILPLAIPHTYLSFRRVRTAEIRRQSWCEVLYPQSLGSPVGW